MIIFCRKLITLSAAIMDASNKHSSWHNVL